jgi:lipopolysaccharide/colanic/teichoic acid biosynthesis glycosyltransferase
MSSPDLSVQSSTQDLVSSPREYVSASNSMHVSRAVERQQPSTFEVINDEIRAATSNVSIHERSDDRPFKYDLNKKKSRDLGWWLILDMFVRQEHWSHLAKLDASSMMIDLQGKRKGEVLKRMVDILIALFLLIILSPVLLVIAICIRMDSRGPALFSHSRVGEGGAEFKLWKFRSMRVDALRYERSPTSSGDPRLTLIGRVIRRISLDEIPQLVNVLKGEMSLVGPRPEMAFIANQYSLKERRRLLVKPGITGLWQISSGRAVPIHHNLQYDLYYIQHGNISLDIAILLRTITAVIRGIGAI